MAMKGQAFAIALVIAAGISMFVMYLSNFESLQRTQQAYYERQRFADVFASLKRAPLLARRPRSRASRASRRSERAWSPTSCWTCRASTSPPTGRLISIPAERRPAVNDLFLRRGAGSTPGGPTRCWRAKASCCERPQSGRSRAGDHQRPPPPADDRRHRALAGVRLQHPARRDRAGRPALRHLLDGAAGAGGAFDMDGGFNDVAL